MSAMMILQFLVLTAVVSGALIFFLHRTLIASTDGAVNRLNKETEDVRAKQSDLNKKIKEADEELAKRKKEADELVLKMTTEAEEGAKAEREKMLNEARAEGEEIIKKAQGTKEEIRKAVLKEMDIRAVDFTIQIIDQVLSERAKGALNQQLFDEFTENLEKVDMGIVSPDINEAEIITAAAIEDSFKKKIAGLIEGKLNRKIEVKAAVDPKIVGGVILRFGSLNLDGSLQTLIKETGIALKEGIEKDQDPSFKK